MLAIPRQSRFSLKSAAIFFVAIALVLSGLYILLLSISPNIPAFYPINKLTPSALAQPKVGQNKIIIPKIGVDIPFGIDGEAALDRGAWWRYPERGSPADGGNFIIAAHRFVIRPTPGETVKKSPFFHIDKLTNGDQIIVDFDGKRYGYKINKTFTVRPSQTEIEAQSETPKLTLYSCELGGTEAGRVVITAEPLGEISLNI